MSYHHLALATQDMTATHAFYEGVMEFELVKVEVAPITEGGWGKHFFYRMDNDDSKFIAFWELHDTPSQDQHQYNLNTAANLPAATNHISFTADSVETLMKRKDKWNAAGLDVLEIDHNWCHSIYTNDPNGNVVEFCLTTGKFSKEDRDRALAAMNEVEFNPSDAPAKIHGWPANAA